MKKIAHVLLLSSCFLLPSCSKSEQVADKNAEVKATEVKTETTTELSKGKKVIRKKTDSGLEYEIEKEGSGESPKAKQSVTVHYTGWLNVDGKPCEKPFDSSVNRGQQFTFIIGVGDVIAGWDEGVMTMKIGEKRRLYIPAGLGYGARGAGALIPPHANLIFDVELFKVD
jgi:peptidylprolyl isomerase